MAQNLYCLSLENKKIKRRKSSGRGCQGFGPVVKRRVRRGDPQALRPDVLVPAMTKKMEMKRSSGPGVLTYCHIHDREDVEEEILWLSMLTYCPSYDQIYGE